MRAFGRRGQEKGQTRTFHPRSAADMIRIDRGETMDTFEPPKYLSSLIATINDGAKAAQTAAFALLVLGLYLLGTMLSASDEDMLLGHTLAIAQLGGQIPVKVSFVLMPALFVALHVFTLTRYDMLAANLRQFNMDLQAMVPFSWNQERCRQLLANVEFIQSLTAPRGSPLRNWLFGVVAWVVIAGFPVLVLLTVQISALRYQSEIMSILQRISLGVDLLALLWFQRRQAHRTVIPKPNEFFGTLRVKCWWWLPVVVVVVNLLWLNIIPSDAVWTNHPTFTDMFFRPLDYNVCPTFGWGCRFLTVDNRPLVGKVWDSKALVALGSDQPMTEKLRASFESIYLRHRRLRHADFSGSRLYGANMIRADLSGAQLITTYLTWADLNCANLTRANLTRADLTAANLTDATLTGANLTATGVVRTWVTRACWLTAPG